jgi:putative DNA primase/helicase
MNFNKRVDSLITATQKISGSAVVNSYCASTIKHDNKTLPSIKTETRPTTNNEIFWEEPILFDELETPEISASLLPASLGKFAEALALASETPESLSVMTVLGVAASIISRLYVVSPKDGWQEPTNIYCIIGLPPANNKTLVLRSCIAPLSAWEKEQREILEPQIKKERSEYKSHEKIIEALRSKAAKEDNKSEQEKLIREITEKETSLIESRVLPCLFITDATPEELAAKVYEQNNYLGIFSDEGGITEVLSGLYTGGLANIDILLKGIDGGDVKIRRKDKNFDLNPLLTIVLTVQPPVIQKMGDKRAYIGNGFLERFLYLLPKSKLGYRTHNTPPIPKEIVYEYQQIIKNLLNTTLAKQEQLKEKVVLTLSPEALADWQDFQRETERELRPSGAFYALQGWAGKICGFALRIAAILHVVKANDGNTIISSESMANALEITALLTQHAIAAYNLISIDLTLQDAKELLGWIITRNNQSFTQAEITYAMRNRKLGKKERLTCALGILIDRNILQTKIDSSTRKPTTYFFINPSLMSKK